MVPWSRSSSIQASKAPGTTAGRKPVPGMRLTPISRSRAMLAAAGATPWPQITVGRSAPAGIRMIGTSPPGPFRCGSTICSVKPVATAASKALPPRSSTPKPTAEAIQCVLATAPKLPRISGRVVKAWAMRFLSQTWGRPVARIFRRVVCVAAPTRAIRRIKTRTTDWRKGETQWQRPMTS